MSCKASVASAAAAMRQLTDGSLGSPRPLRPQRNGVWCGKTPVTQKQSSLAERRLWRSAGCAGGPAGGAGRRPTARARMLQVGPVSSCIGSFHTFWVPHQSGCRLLMSARARVQPAICCVQPSIYHVCCRHLPDQIAEAGASMHELIAADFLRGTAFTGLDAMADGVLATLRRVHHSALPTTAGLSPGCSRHRLCSVSKRRQPLAHSVPASGHQLLVPISRVARAIQSRYGDNTSLPLIPHAESALAAFASAGEQLEQGPAQKAAAEGELAGLVACLRRTGRLPEALAAARDAAAVEVKQAVRCSTLPPLTAPRTGQPHRQRLPSPGGTVCWSARPCILHGMHQQCQQAVPHIFSAQAGRWSSVGCRCCWRKTTARAPRWQSSCRRYRRLRCLCCWPRCMQPRGPASRTAAGESPSQLCTCQFTEDVLLSCKATSAVWT
jgi:hypothetical protein